RGQRRGYQRRRNRCSRRRRCQWVQTRGHGVGLRRALARSGLHHGRLRCRHVGVLALHREGNRGRVPEKYGDGSRSGNAERRGGGSLAWSNRRGEKLSRIPEAKSKSTTKDTKATMVFLISFVSFVPFVVEVC